MQILLLKTDLKSAYAMSEDERNLIQNLAPFLANVPKEQGQLVEKFQDLRDQLMETLRYALLISVRDETEIFKICLEFWDSLSSKYFHSQSSIPTGNFMTNFFPK